jgi:hypothetical protein
LPNASRLSTSSPSLSSDLLSPPRPRRDGARTQGCSRNCRPGPLTLNHRSGRAANERELRGCTSSAAETASPVRLHQLHSRGRFTRAVHQRHAEARCPCGRSRHTPKRAPQASLLTEAEALEGANTLATSPDKPPESLTIQLCEQRRREADTECRHNRKRNLRRRVQREQEAKSSTKVRQPSDMTRKPHQWPHLDCSTSHHPAPEGMELGRKVAAETAALDQTTHRRRSN